MLRCFWTSQCRNPSRISFGSRKVIGLYGNIHLLWLVWTSHSCSFRCLILKQVCILENRGDVLESFLASINNTLSEWWISSVHKFYVFNNWFLFLFDDFLPAQVCLLSSEFESFYSCVDMHQFKPFSFSFLSIHNEIAIWYFSSVNSVLQFYSQTKDNGWSNFLKVPLR